MKVRSFLAATILVAGSTAAMADVMAPIPSRATSISLSTGSGIVDRVPSLLYSATTQSGSRFNPGTGGTPAGSGTQQDVSFDDIPIANPGNLLQISITQITFGVRRIGSTAAPAVPVDVNLFATTLTTDHPNGIGNAIDQPFTSLGTAILPGGGTTSVTQIITVNFGVPLVLNLNNTLFNPSGGIGAFAIGAQFSGANAANNANGIRLSGVDAGFLNANQLFWVYDSDKPAPSDRGAFSFGVPGGAVPPSTFHITVTGELVPTPGAAGLLAIGGLVATRRRR